MIIYNIAFLQSHSDCNGVFMEVIVMFRTVINISSFDNAKKFVNVTSKYDDVQMRLRVDNYEIDAHSIVGVLSIVDSEKNAVFTANITDNEEPLKKDLEPFIVNA